MLYEVTRFLICSWYSFVNVRCSNDIGVRRAVDSFRRGVKMVGIIQHDTAGIDEGVIKPTITSYTAFNSFNAFESTRPLCKLDQFG